MMLDVKVSFIVPVYNTEQHLSGCVDSILSNSSYGYEIILVDDGSTDGSPAVCDDYESRYENITAIHKENGGLSSARNAGIAAAKGRYITFIDSDDYVDPGYIDHLAIYLDRGDDIICYPYWIDYTEITNTRKHDLSELLSVSPADAVRALESGSAFNMVCNKLYRRELLDRAPRTEFTLSAEPGEDLIFNCFCFMKAKTVSLTNKPFYHWVRRGEDTLANRFRRDLYEKNKLFIRFRTRLYRSLNMEETDAAALAGGNLTYIFSCVPNMYRGKDTFPRKERIAFYQEILHSEEVAGWIRCDPPGGTLKKQFAKLYRTGSPFLMDTYYFTAGWARRRFDKIWQIFRKSMKI